MRTDYPLSVTTTGTTLPDNLPSLTDCMFGDTVEIVNANGNYGIGELVVLGKQSESSFTLQ